jgi:benzoylformate decarboxylase
MVNNNKVLKTVRQVAYGLLRTNGMTTVFGNPGSNELPFLSQFPSDFRYILGLHEGVVLGMADGYAQATGRPALVNVHSAAGLGNAMGVLVNASVSHTPLVIMAGQQTRAMIALEAQLTNFDATQLPRPLVKWSFEPPRAEDVPAALARAIHTAMLPPRGPVFVSVPFDDWSAPAEDSADLLLARRVTGSGAVTSAIIESLAVRLATARNPVLIVGAEVDTPEAFQASTQLAETNHMPVWIAPSASRCPFPTTHPLFRGVLPFAIGRLSAKLTGHDLILVFGAPVFRYHEYLPGAYLPEGAQLVAVTSDPAEAARAPVGEAIVADPQLVLCQLANAVRLSERLMPQPRPRPEPATGKTVPLNPETVFDVLNEVKPDEAVIVNESTSNTESFWHRIAFDRARSFYFPAAGALGFGIPAAVGIQLAEPGRPVIGVIGDGSANYGITGLWSAAHHRVPATFLILRNDEYGVLKWFAGTLKATGLPGLDLPGIDYCAIAQGYGVRAVRIATRDELAAALVRCIASDSPSLIEVPIRSVG